MGLSCEQWGLSRRAPIATQASVPKPKATAGAARTLSTAARPTSRTPFGGSRALSSAASPQRKSCLDALLAAQGVAVLDGGLGSMLPSQESDHEHNYYFTISRALTVTPQLPHRSSTVTLP